MSAQPVEPLAPSRWSPLDPDSDRGRAVTAGLAQILAGVEMRKAAKAAKAAETNSP